MSISNHGLPAMSMLGLLFSVLLVAFPAAAAAPTRAEFTARAESICERGTAANRTVLRGVEKMVRKGHLASAGRRFRRAAAALDRVVGRLARLPRPAADQARIARWLTDARRGGKLLRQIGDALQRGRRSRAEQLVDRLLKTAKRANAVVVGFDFEYCRLDPARFA